jgi:hypothetical protein
LTKEGKVYGSGKMNKGQLGFMPASVKDKYQFSFVQVPLPSKAYKVHAGSLYSMAACRDE